MKKIRNITKVLAISMILTTSSACVKNIKAIGYNPESEKFDLLEVGKTRKAVVKRDLGSPSAVSTYGIETWYYISTVQESIAFLKPKIKSQRVVAIEFDPNQTIRSVTSFDELDSKEIEISKDVTKSKGHDEGVIRQMLSNVGRFNTNRNDAATPSN